MPHRAGYVDKNVHFEDFYAGLAGFHGARSASKNAPAGDRGYTEAPSRSDGAIEATIWIERRIQRRRFAVGGWNIYEHCN
jgi:hypothetical protein